MIDIKSSVKNLWSKVSANDYELARTKLNLVTTFISQKIEARRNSPARFRHESDTSEGGIKYYTTENNPLSVGAQKVEAAGIDKFGDEKDTFDPDVDATDDLAIRTQRINLSDRFYSPGLDLDKN